MNSIRPGFTSLRRLVLPFVFIVLCTAAYSAGALPPQQTAFPAWAPMPAGVQAEGVAVDKPGNVYVSVREGDTGVVLRYDKQGGVTRLAEIAHGMIGGLAVTAEGDVYAAVALGEARGVYRISQYGDVELVPGTGQIFFANALAFDRQGTLYITESHSLAGDSYGPGGIWRVTRNGYAEPWLRHPMLTGIGAVLGYPVGANGIGVFGGDLYVVNTDKSMVVRVPVAKSGDPGVPEVWATLGPVVGSPLSANPAPPMGDGLALDVHGNVYVTVVSRAAVVRLNAGDRTQHTIAMFQFGPPTLPLNAPLDTPASLAFGTGSGERQQLFVTNLGWMSTLAPGLPWPGPGLVKIDAGAPGLPLR